MNLIYESESPVGKNSLDDSLSLNQSDNETKEIDSTTVPSSNLNVASKYFEDELNRYVLKILNKLWWTKTILVRLDEILMSN